LHPGTKTLANRVRLNFFGRGLLIVLAPLIYTSTDPCHGKGFDTTLLHADRLYESGNYTQWKIPWQDLYSILIKCAIDAHIHSE